MINTWVISICRAIQLNVPAFLVYLVLLFSHFICFFANFLALLLLHFNLPINDLRIYLLYIYSLTLKDHHHWQHLLLSLIVRMNPFWIFFKFFGVFLQELRADTLMIIVFVLTILIEISIREVVILSGQKNFLVAFHIGILYGTQTLKLSAYSNLSLFSTNLTFELGKFFFSFPNLCLIIEDLLISQHSFDSFFLQFYLDIIKLFFKIWVFFLDFRYFIFLPFLAASLHIYQAVSNLFAFSSLEPRVVYQIINDFKLLKEPLFRIGLEKVSKLQGVSLYLY